MGGGEDGGILHCGVQGAVRGHLWSLPEGLEVPYPPFHLQEHGGHPAGEGEIQSIKHVCHPTPNPPGNGDLKREKDTKKVKKQPLKVVPIGKELPAVIKILDEKQGEKEEEVCVL